jgi:murein DD-endopeptidase MepM/ murein hydrolase activator NlpD
MKFKLLIISLCIFFCSQLTVFSQEAADTTNNDSEETLGEDNLSDSTLKESIVLPFSESAVPAAGIYKVWSNDRVDPYDIDITKKTDTSIINLSGYVHPIAGRINSDFGWRRWRWHYGTDIKLQTGDTVRCTFDGLVRIAKRSKSFGYYVVVRHFNGLETVYGHLSKIKVNVNQPIKAGELLGLGGSTGHSTGPHLHYEIRYLGNPINPNDVVDFQTNRLKIDTLYLCQKQFNYVSEIRRIRYHMVRRGDTLYKISRRYGVSIVTLCKLNNMRKTKMLRVGQHIRYT